MFRYADIRTELEREPQISVSEVPRSAAARATSVAHLAFAQLPFPSPAGTAADDELLLLKCWSTFGDF